MKTSCVKLMVIFLIKLIFLAENRLEAGGNTLEGNTC